MAVQPYWDGTTTTNYTVRATDSTGLSVTAPLSVTVSSSRLLRVSHSLRMTVITDYELFSSEISHALWWLGNVSAYFTQSPDHVTMLGVEPHETRGVVITWSNNTINSIDPPYTCPLALIYELFEVVDGTGFRASLSQYLISSVTLSLQGICEGFTTSTTTQSTSTSTTISTTRVTTPTTTSTSTTTTTPTTTTSKSSVYYT